jgi:hypothetical protein
MWKTKGNRMGGRSKSWWEISMDIFLEQIGINIVDWI